MTPQGRKAEVVACPTCSTPCERDTYSTYNGDLIGTYKPVPAQSLIDMQARLDNVAYRLDGCLDDWSDDMPSRAFGMLSELVAELRTLLTRDATTTEEPGEGG